MTGKTRWVAMITLLLLGLNAFGGGWYGLSGAVGVDPAWLAGSPFTDYTIPSLFLFVVIGGGSMATLVLWARRHALAPLASVGLGVIVMAWIVIQVAIITLNSFLQPLSFAAGLLLVAVGASVLRGAPARRAATA